MKAVVLLCRHFSTTKPVQALVLSTQYTLLSGDACNDILDKYPDIKTLKKLHAQIIINQHLHSNPSIGLKLMRTYGACGQMVDTRHVFDEITNKNVVFFNVLIRSYVNNYLYYDALHVYKNMSVHGFDPDCYTYPCVLKACSGSNSLLVGLQIHCSVVKVGLDYNLFNGNGLVAMYGKCGCLKEARRVLNDMPSKDVVTWNSMVAGYAQNGRFDEALDVCREMESLRIKPDADTMASLLPSVTNTSPENVLSVKEMFLKLDNKNLVSWNVMIAVYANNSMPAEAVDLYLQMEVHGIEPNAISVASVLPACGDLSALLLGRKIHRYVERKKLQPNLRLENALVDMYAKCGSLTEARTVFDQMRCQDVVSWTSMISAYGMSGQGYDAVALFSKMLMSGLCPDSIAFVSVLSACSHAGLLEEGRYYFKIMTEQYKLVPRIEHFACLVDLLGRAGKVEEAYDLIKQMPMEPNERIWGSLVAACCLYSNMDIGILAADHIFHLAPNQSGYYVLLSNIYAKAGRWGDVKRVRKFMNSKGIKKMPGASVEMNDQVQIIALPLRSSKCLTTGPKNVPPIV
ncbi:hypothetical protein CISIN_1g008276mg [Citrus sinensis]|uniref:Pentacotripeptide-repeat region of PRORP domain-containing protein n=1 Tax=Citrus sinensis TaxID=2711 RepID=A0A067EM74_CITSI|nr:hypothetical protein CISIN_1g008276mg [Citrus sinensis]